MNPALSASERSDAPTQKKFQASAAKRQNAISELANRAFYVLPHVLPFFSRGYNITAVIPRLTLISPRVHIYNNVKVPCV